MSNTMPNILIVDDVADNLQVLSNILKNEGYQPRPVPSGDLAFKTMQVSLPDLILLDVKMPNMNGYEICQHLKADEKFRDIPVIFISALGETEDKVRAFEVGGVDYITKPFQAREIVARVKTHLALCQMRQALSRMNMELDQRVQERTRELESRNDQLRREIDERQRVEEALQFTRFSLEHSADGIFWIKPNGQIVDVNEAACRSLGYSRDEIIRLFVPDVDPDHSVEKWCQHWIDLRQLGTMTIESRHLTKAGQEIEVEICANYVSYGGQEYNCAIVRNIAERKRAEEAVRSALDEKTVLLKEIHHRVKNNLQIIISLLNLQGGRVQNAEAMEILNVTRNRVYSMALLHETLYRSENFAHVDLAQYIKQVTTHLQRSFGLLAARINLQCVVSGVAIGLDQAVPCGLIINELVSNAFKYAFPDGRAGNITVEMKTSENNLVTMDVIDDGVGFPPEMDIENTSTLGLKLVSILSAQLDGKLEVERNKGTLFHLTFLAKSK
jgi:PAS domain S-box-containing protein